MKSVFLFLLSFAGLCAQVPAPPASLAPETVIATVDGRKLTFGELQSYVTTLSPEAQKAALTNKGELLREYALMAHLSRMAEEGKLDQKAPYKEAIASSRMQILTNAQLNEQYLNSQVLPAEQRQFFDANKDRYTQVKLKVIYIGFAADPAAKAPDGVKYHSEAEAKAKIEDIQKRLRGGADFVKLVKELSEDEKSKNQDGDFGTLRKADNLPPDIKNVVFTLKQGEVSSPVKQRNGFYLFRAEEVGVRPYAEVKDDIYTELKQTHLKEWIDGMTKSIPLKIENDAFMAPNAPAVNQ